MTTSSQAGTIQTRQSRQRLTNGSWGQARMNVYSLYFMNPNTGHIDRVRTIEANDDVEAIRIAGQSDHRPLEVWDGNRKVHRLEMIAIGACLPVADPEKAA